VCVAIESPISAALYGFELESPAKFTEKIRFKARAYKGSRELSDNDVTWSVDGNEIGKGLDFERALPLAVPGQWQAFKVRVVATDGVTSDSDEVIINVGFIP
jgi:hypothetical protein